MGLECGISGSARMTQVSPVVFVVDDDLSVRESLVALLHHEGWRTEAFETAQHFLNRPRTTSPSCVILDVNLPDLSGLDLQERLRAEHVEMPIIFLTGYGDIPLSVKAMKAGAAEFLTKPFVDSVLLDAVRGAIQRSREALAQNVERASLSERFDALSRRERDVMTLVVQGFLNKQVGGKLGISEITVKAHRGKVMQKMNAKTFADLVNMAARLGLSTGRQS